jgi:hypothetical protein
MLTTPRNFHSLKDQGLANAHEQGSQAWLDGRKGRITGSKPSTLFFNFKEEKDWDIILEQWFGDKKEDFDEIALARMAHGSHFESLSVKVILDSIPFSHFYECPQIDINENYSASADGLIQVFDPNKPTNWRANVEIKCPAGGIGNSQEKMEEILKNKWKLPASYYMVQIHLECCAQNAKETLFVCTTPLLTRMWLVKFDQEYWNLCLEVLENFRLKNVGFEVMLSKINKLKRASFRISKSAVLFQDVETVFDELKDECVVKKIKKYCNL